MSDINSDDEFFEKFSKVFARNAKFSKDSPVPNIGFANTKYEEVNVFYKFWD